MGIIILWIVFGFIGYAIGKGKGRPLEGFLWGGLLGLIGIIVITCRGKTEEKLEEDLRASIEREKRVRGK